ncbi:MAG: response regulator SirA, partial [Lysinibacillus sp.]
TLKAEENDMDQLSFEEDLVEEHAARPVVLVDTIQALGSTTVVGSDVGNTCPVCRKGTVEEMGGCNTCTNCGAQLKCGL